ncbi:MAG: glycosyltransferase family 4 protein [Amphiplicatus sp.]
MRVLTLTTLYPNAAAPAHGVFVENRLCAFKARSDADIRVIAPAPWFPPGIPFSGKYAAYANAPRTERRREIEVRHPRYAIPPKIGMNYAARALERCFLHAARELVDEGWDFDLIDAHYLYPDGVAAARVAKALGKPVILTARGSDVTLLPTFPRQRRMILDAVDMADAVIAVSASLKAALLRLGVEAEKIHVFRNGVDLDRFRPLDRQAIRDKLGVTGKVIASVGHLIERKGHHLAITALTLLPEASLLIVGSGEERGALADLAHCLGVESRVRFLGGVPHDELAEIYNAADALILASSREGWPNVLLEAMACGTPVIATPASAEVIRAAAAGRIASERAAPAIAEALGALLAAPPDRQTVRRYAEDFSWDETADNLYRLFTRVLRQPAPPSVYLNRALSAHP